MARTIFVPSFISFISQSVNSVSSFWCPYKLSKLSHPWLRIISWRTIRQFQPFGCPWKNCSLILLRTHGWLEQLLLNWAISVSVKHSSGSPDSGSSFTNHPAILFCYQTLRGGSTRHKKAEEKLTHFSCFFFSTCRPWKQKSCCRFSQMGKDSQSSEMEDLKDSTTTPLTALPTLSLHKCSL